jgi:regulator of RNase E activity RraA
MTTRGEQRMNNDLRSRLARLSTPGLSDALDTLGLDATPRAIRPMSPSMRMVGRAYTVRYVPLGAITASSGDWLDEVQPGDVAVIDNSGRTDCTVWGDIMTSVAAARGIAGTLIAGMCRDVYRCVEIGYPVFAVGNFMRTGKDRVQVADTQVAVNIGGVRVNPGDWIVGDADGAVVIPQEVVDQVVKTAEEISAKEAGIQALAVETGLLREARERFGYHELQRHVEH